MISPRSFSIFRVRSPCSSRSSASAGNVPKGNLRGVRQTSLTREPYRTLKVTVADLDERVKRMDTELARGLGGATLRSKLDRQLQALRPKQRMTLRRSLPVPQRGLVAGTIAAGVAAARAFAQEQGHER